VPTQRGPAPPDADNKEGTMKHLQALLVGLIVVAVATSSGCVYSLRPWFGEDAQVLDDRLLGEWLNVEEDGSVDDDVVVVEQTSWNTYRVSEWGVCALAHIGGRHYFDCDQSGTEDLLEPWELPCHSLFLITVKKDKVTLRLLDPEKVEKFLRDNASVQGIRVESSNSETGEQTLKAFLIVSETPNLERFLKAHGSADIWADVTETYVRPE
jgi:hypothetical protein